MKMPRVLTTAIAGLTLGTIAIFLGGVFSWGYYSTALSDRALSLAFAWPFVVAHSVLPLPESSRAGFLVAVIINYSFYFGLAWLLLRFRRKASAAA